MTWCAVLSSWTLNDSLRREATAKDIYPTKPSTRLPVTPSNCHPWCIQWTWTTRLAWESESTYNMCWNAWSYFRDCCFDWRWYGAKLRARRPTNHIWSRYIRNVFSWVLTPSRKFSLWLRLLANVIDKASRTLQLRDLQFRKEFVNQDRATFTTDFFFN